MTSTDQNQTPSRLKKRLLAIAGVILTIGVAAAIVWLISSRSPLESTYGGVRGEGASKTAIIQIRNDSDRQVNLSLVYRIYYRYRGREWELNTPGLGFPGVKIPGYVKPGATVDFPILLRTPEGEPISGPVEIGIRYGTAKSTWIAYLPAGIRSFVGSTFGTSEGKAVNGVQWTAFAAP